MLTTSKGQCRDCKHTWAVPRTPIGPDRVREDPSGISYFEFLPKLCPLCSSPCISWIYDPIPHTRVAEAKRFMRDYTP